MGFIRLFPLEEIHPTDPARFGYGDPARVQAIERFAAPEWVVQVSEIRRFEDCPLYLVSADDQTPTEYRFEERCHITD